MYQNKHAYELILTEILLFGEVERYAQAPKCLFLPSLFNIFCI